MDLTLILVYLAIAPLTFEPIEGTTDQTGLGLNRSHENIRWKALLPVLTSIILIISSIFSFTRLFKRHVNRTVIVTFTFLFIILVLEEYVQSSSMFQIYSIYLTAAF